MGGGVGGRGGAIRGVMASEILINTRLHPLVLTWEI